MATETPVLGLELPAANDFYDVEKFNSNFRKIDTSMAQKVGWTKQSITGSVLEWAVAQNTPMIARTGDDTTDLPPSDSKNWIADLKLSNTDGRWKVLILTGVTNNEVWYRIYNWTSWNAEWRKSLDDRTTPTSIGAAASSHEHSAGNITSGTLAIARIPTVTAAKGGTGKTSVTSGSYLVGNGTGAMTEKTPAQVLSHIGAAASGHTHTPASIGAAPSSHEHSAGNITSGTFGVARGGTGKASVASGSYLVGNGTGAMTEKTPAQVLSHIGAAASGHTHTPASIGAAASDHTHTPASIGAADASILGQIITAFGEIGVDDVTVVYATLCLKKLTATKCDLHISFKIESNTKDSSKFNFISFSKICSLLGITSVTASSSSSVVKFDPLVSISGNDLTVISRQTPANMGYAGVHAILSTNGIGFGRYYKTDGSYGGWPLNNGLYDAGTYGQIDFYGANYAV